MIYRSNLTAPDLQPYFRHVYCRPMPHSMGHDVLSDFADCPDGDPVLGMYKQCGFLTHDEAAILYHCVTRIKGKWLDLGCHTGWTSAHMAEAGALVTAVDPMLGHPQFRWRFDTNMRPWLAWWLDLLDTVVSYTSRQFFASLDLHEIFRGMEDTTKFSGVLIDGDHEPGEPLHDAQRSAACLADTGVILLHDFIGMPVRDAVRWLMDQGFRCRIYWTPHMMACCWRGNYTPPDHVRDPAIDWEPVKAGMSDFDFGRCA